MRIDKYIWAIRLFKTRTIAGKACTFQKVRHNNIFVKPSKTVVIGDEISVKTIPIWRTFKIIAIPTSRIGAKLVSDYMLETTTTEDLMQLKQFQELNRQKKVFGIKGRPTKKDRRTLDKLH